MAAPSRPHPLADLLAEAGVRATPDHLRVIAVLEETGHDQAAVSLLRTYAAHLVPAPRPAEAARFWGEPMPAGADPEAAAGLPSNYRLGVDRAGRPWWYCTICASGRYGLVDLALERRDAERHDLEHHRGGERR